MVRTAIVEGVEGSGIPAKGLVVASAYGAGAKVVLKVSGKTSGCNIHMFGLGAQYQGRSGSFVTTLTGSGHYEVEIPLVTKTIIDGNYA